MGRIKNFKMKVRRQTEQSSAKFFGTIFQNKKVQHHSNRLLNWAENNRKGMFTITITFLGLVLLFAIVMRPSKSFNQVYTDGLQEAGIDSIENRLPATRKSIDFGDVLEVKQMQEEVNALREKGELSRQDSIKILELYQRLTKMQEQ